MNARLRSYLPIAAVGVSVLLAGWWAAAQDAHYHNAPASAAQQKNPYAGQSTAAAAGAKLYAANCASCHGANGQGTGNIPALTAGPTQSAPDGEVFWFITKGSINNGMPGWGQLPEQERWQIVTYLKSLRSSASEKSGSPVSEAYTPVATNAPLPQPPFTDFRVEEPGKIRKITAPELPAPYVTDSANNGPQVVARPADAWPKAPQGFTVQLYATGLDNPRLIRTAPNGDFFLAESSVGDIRIFRGITADGKPKEVSVFASELNRPYGIAFYPVGNNPQWVYIGNTDAVVRFPYRNGELKASGPAEHIVDLPHGGGHWTRDIQFSPDGKTMFVAVGSSSNVDDPDTTPAEKNRADILEFNPDGSNMRVYAYGIRNAGGGLAIDPKTGALWCSVNERDGLGDNLVPDYITHVEAGGFYGWPWYYMGSHQDPRHQGKHPELRDKVLVPDVLLQPHNASLEITFYEGSQFPAEYKDDIFASEHGSWNRAVRSGYEVIRVPMHHSGHASGEYEDFVTGFVVDNRHVWGRPVGVTVAPDGSLLFTDDGSNSIWRVVYTGASTQKSAAERRHGQQSEKQNAR
ncbi:MAG TPA: PQQ-dependent sugar dehydrogenase [Candidatus Eremiobacteraceae bacterium]|nr:PQQ-dependent sugar dehydrogenase [Candidatus Eremiobacteraceae bacterium]